MIPRAIARPTHAQTVWNSLSSIIFTSVATTSATPSTAVIVAVGQPRIERRGQRTGRTSQITIGTARSAMYGANAEPQPSGALAPRGGARADPLPRREHLQEERDGEQQDQLRAERPPPVVAH